jgi:hypothetical protein
VENPVAGKPKGFLRTRRTLLSQGRKPRADFALRPWELDEDPSALGRRFASARERIEHATAALAALPEFRGAVTVTLGTGLAFEVFAALVIGGVSLYGGRGSMIGALGGVLLIGVIRTALNLMDISPFWVDAIRGMVILLAVTLDALVMTYQARWRRSAPVTLDVEGVSEMADTIGAQTTDGPGT